MSRREFLTWAAAVGVGAATGAAFELDRKKESAKPTDASPLDAETPIVEKQITKGKEIKETRKKYAVGAFLDEEIDRLAQAIEDPKKKVLLLSESARIKHQEKEKIYARRFSKSKEQMAKYFEQFLKSQEDIRDALTEADPLKLIPRAVLCGIIGMEGGGRQAVNRQSGAAGIWQLNLITAKHLGLKVDKNVDERMDLKKSSSAAARYLLDLYERFGRQWGLALVAYAGGPEKLSWRICQHFKLDSGTTFTHDLLSKKNINAVTLYSRRFSGLGNQHSVQYPFGAQAMAGWIGELLKMDEEYEEEGESALV